MDFLINQPWPIIINSTPWFLRESVHLGRDCIVLCIVCFICCAFRTKSYHYKTFYSKIIHQHRNTKLKRDCVPNHINQNKGYIQINTKSTKRNTFKIKSISVVSRGITKLCRNFLSTYIHFRFKEGICLR